MKKIFAFLVGAFCSMACASVPITHTLHNGLTLVLKEDHRAPMVLTEMWYKVGSADEVNGHTGLSHILEHALFFATQHIPHDQMKTFVAKRGGSENAFTSQDHTTYYTYLPKQYLADALYLESERMQNARFPKTLFDNELKVIQEERRLRIDDNPSAKGLEFFYALAHIRSPYHHPVIGWATDIENTTREQAKNWYKRWYAPNNAVLVIVGDIQAAPTLQMIKKYFDDIPRKTIDRAPARPSLPPMGMRMLHLSTHAQAPFIIEGFNVPSLGSAPHSEEPYALRVLAAILSEGNSARLDQTLIHQNNLITSVGIYYPMFQRYQSTMTLHITPRFKINHRAIERAIDDILEDLKHHLVTQEELNRAKAQIIANDTYQKDALSAQAYALGQRALLRLPLKDEADFKHHIQKVSATEIQAVIQKYFTKENLTLVYFDPLGYAS